MNERQIIWNGAENTRISLFKEKKFIHIHFSEKMGLTPSFIYFPSNFSNRTYCDWVDPRTYNVRNTKLGRGKVMASLRLHMENKKETKS